VSEVRVVETRTTIRRVMKIEGAEPMSRGPWTDIRIVPARVEAEWVNDGNAVNVHVHGPRLLKNGSASELSWHEVWLLDGWPDWLTELLDSAAPLPEGTQP
jgi:hypothetical protein